MVVPGTGFLIAENKQKTNLVFPPPNQDVRDLILTPAEEIPIEEDWLKSPLFMGKVQAGDVTLRRDETLPQRGAHQIAKEYEDLLPPTDKQFVYTICRYDITEGVRANIHLADRLDRAGRPQQGTRVTKAFLQGRHIHILKAALELEGRYQDRSAVKKELRQEIKKIEAL